MAVEARVVVKDEKLTQYIHELQQAAYTLNKISMGLHDIIGFEVDNLTLAEDEQGECRNSNVDNENLPTAAGT